jgi:hypothetical protein
MDDWDGFYTLAGSTAGTLIGLIFVVITLGIEHAEKDDDLRARLFVTRFSCISPAFWLLRWRWFRRFRPLRARSPSAQSAQPVSPT